MRISRRSALLAAFAGLFIPESVMAADIYTVTATLDMQDGGEPDRLREAEGNQAGAEGQRAVENDPAQADDGPVLGVGLAVDVTSGQVRWASPVGALTEVVPGLLAASARYGAPEALCYDDPELEDSLSHIGATLSIAVRRTSTVLPPLLLAVSSSIAALSP